MARQYSFFAPDPPPKGLPEEAYLVIGEEEYIPVYVRDLGVLMTLKPRTEGMAGRRLREVEHALAKRPQDLAELRRGEVIAVMV